MELQTVHRVRALLAEAGNAHHDFEQKELGGGQDQNWPAWYATYLLSHGLDTLIDHRIRQEGLARLLRECDAEYRRDRPQEEWPEYYARRIVAAGWQITG